LARLGGSRGNAQRIRGRLFNDWLRHRDEESLEPGFEKVALFADSTGKPANASRQLPSGAWTSKLGNAEDIEHELHALEGEIYGVVALLLKRPLPLPQRAPA
jgi:hypothetical protein